MSDYQSTLHRLLGDDRSLKKRITFIIDGVDHLDDFDTVLDLLSFWSSLQLPHTIKVLMTMRNGHQLERLRAQLPESAFYQVVTQLKDYKADYKVLIFFSSARGAFS